MTKKKLDTIKTSGFKTPKDYFSQVEEHILNEVYLKNKVDDTGFQVPDSYFDTLEDRVFNTIENETETKVVKLFPWKKIIYASSIAAALVLMFNVFSTSKTVTWESLEMASIENYLEEEDYTSYELATLLTEDELNKDNFIDNEISETSIEDYLLNNAELEELIIE